VTLSQLLKTNLAELLAKRASSRKLAELGDSDHPAAATGWSETTKTWLVFLLCLGLTLAGVVVSFLVFGSTITGTKKWGVALVVSVVMLGLTYGAKYSNPNSRSDFTPVDALQYLSQAFLWPSTWPALADLVGIQKVAPPPVHSYLLTPAQWFIAAAWTWFHLNN
jgi:hypothetical protein